MFSTLLYVNLIYKNMFAILIRLLLFRSKLERLTTTTILPSTKDYYYTEAYA